MALSLAALPPTLKLPWASPPGLQTQRRPTSVLGVLFFSFFFFFKTIGKYLLY